MSKQRFNPYTDLAKRIERFFEKIRYAHTAYMWTWKKEDMADDSIKELYHRTLAAHQLGYDVFLIAHDAGMYVQYRKKITVPTNVWEL